MIIPVISLSCYSVIVIRAIIFDCFGVLTTDTWNVFLDSLPTGADIQAAREVHRQYDAGLISKNECTKQILNFTGQTFTELEDMHTPVLKNVKLLEYIKTIKPNYKIGLLSNIGNDWVREEFLTRDEQQLFDQMVFSYEIGVNKPDERMYTTICERLGVQPNQAVMIDDKVGYCDAAQKLTMRAIVYRDFESMKTQLEAILTEAK